MIFSLLLLLSYSSYACLPNFLAGDAKSLNWSNWGNAKMCGGANVLWEKVVREMNSQLSQLASPNFDRKLS